MSTDEGFTMYQMLAGLELYTSRVGYLPDYIVMTERGAEYYKSLLIPMGTLYEANFCGIPIITTTELTKELSKKTK